MNMAQAPIKVLITDDSAFMRTALRRMIETDPAIQVVGQATDGNQALKLIAEFDPDVVTLDVEMPGMSGLDCLRHIMAERPRPVIMISSLTQEGAETTLQALDDGAFDYIPKQLSHVSLDIVKIKHELIAKIHAAASAPRRAPIPQKRAVVQQITHSVHHAVPKIICIGTSTGGPKALQEILPQLPEDLPVPVLVVQHMPVGFTGPFARRLDGLSKIKISEAIADEPLEPGHVYIGPASWQITPYRRSTGRFAIKLSKDPSNTPHIPSVDVMMLASASVFGSSAMGIILTGMGNDGEAGIRAMHRAGGYTIAQDEQTCTVYGMPRACAEARIVHHSVPLSMVPAEIMSAVRYRQTPKVSVPASTAAH
jgi:two-component system chemotaxis response regulator CheB